MPDAEISRRYPPFRASLETEATVKSLSDKPTGFVVPHSAWQQFAGYPFRYGPFRTAQARLAADLHKYAICDEKTVRMVEPDEWTDYLKGRLVSANRIKRRSVGRLVDIPAAMLSDDKKRQRDLDVLVAQVGLMSERESKARLRAISGDLPSVTGMLAYIAETNAMGRKKRTA